jgi:hypothetical protein
MKDDILHKPTLHDSGLSTLVCNPYGMWQTTVMSEFDLQNCESPLW